MQQVGTAQARAMKPRVNCMSAAELVIKKAHANFYLPQHAVHYTARSQTQ